MRIREFQHGTFTVLIVTSFDVNSHDFISLMSALPVEKAIRALRERLGVTGRFLHARGGQVVDFLGPPVIALWPCAEQTPDRRAFEAALAVASEERDARSRTGQADTGRRELAMGACCGPLIFQRDGETISVPSVSASCPS